MATRDSSGESPTGDAETSGLRPSLFDSILPLATLALLIGGSLARFGLDALDGPIQVALILCALVAATLFAGVRGAFLQPDVVQDFASEGGGP